MTKEIQYADILQITNDSHHWYPSLVIVSEVKSFGCTAYAFIPQKRDTGTAAPAYIRLGKEDYEKVGHAKVVCATTYDVNDEPNGSDGS